MLLTTTVKKQNVTFNSVTGPPSRCHVKGHISFHPHLPALPETGAGASGLGRRPASVGSQESDDQGPAAPSAQASSQAAAAPAGPGPCPPGPLQRHGGPQHLHVRGHERSVRGAEGPRHGQRPDGDGAGGDGVGPGDGYYELQVLAPSHTTPDTLLGAPFLSAGMWTLSSKMKQTSALRLAACGGRAGIVEELLFRGAEVNADPGGNTALHDACAGGHDACVQLLLSHGADPEVLAADGSAPLHLCTSAQSFQ